MIESATETSFCQNMHDFKEKEFLWKMWYSGSWDKQDNHFVEPFPEVLFWQPARRNWLATWKQFLIVTPSCLLVGLLRI